LKGLLKRAYAVGRRRDTLADGTLNIYEADLTRWLDRLMSLIPTHKAGHKFQTIIKKVRRHLFELWRKLGDGGEEGGVTGLVIKPPEPPRWSVTP